jgi:hypothetical protein
MTVFVFLCVLLMLSSLFSKIPNANHVEVALQTKAISSSSPLWFLLPIYTTTLLFELDTISHPEELAWQIL